MPATVNVGEIRARDGVSTDWPSFCCVIPAFRARDTVCGVVEAALRYVDAVIVIDDACPQQSGQCVTSTFKGDSRVRVISRESNGGVGAAVKDGIEHALELGANVIVKIDADGQMDPAFIPTLVNVLQDDTEIAMVKGNRFVDEAVLQQMPLLRLMGNSALSLLVKFASGYWNMLDPTNGFIAFNANRLRVINWRRFANGYFFEISVLCDLGLKRAAIAHVDMPTIYGSENSSLSVLSALAGFPLQLLRRFLRRLLLQYFIFDINVGSLYLFLGTLLSVFGLAFGVTQWVQSVTVGVARPAGVVMLAALTFLMGFQLILNALLYDVQFGPRLLDARLLERRRKHTRRTMAVVGTHRK